MQNLPEVGKTYASTMQPGLLLHVCQIDTLTQAENEGHPATFFVEACYPDEIDNMQAIGLSLDESEWNAHGFIPE